MDQSTITKQVGMVRNIVLLLFCFLVFSLSVAAYPTPSAVIGELTGPGSQLAYVYVTAFDLTNGNTLYYNSFQANEQGQFVEVIPLDTGTNFKLTVQFFPSTGTIEDDLVVLSYEMQAGDEQYINYVFEDVEDSVTEEETEESESTGSESSGGSGGGSGNSVGRVIEVPDLDEVIAPDMSGSPLTEEQEGQLEEIIENGDIVKDNQIMDENGGQEILSKEQSYIDSLIEPIKNSDFVAMMLLASMIMVFITILILLVLPEREKSDEEEIKRAQEEANKPISKRNLRLKGEGNFVGNLDSEIKVNDLKENDFEFVGDTKK